jgi:ketosteroid isomerase-like protein
MSTQQNTKIVQEAYAAFGRGDIQAVLGSLADNVDWHAIIGAGPQVPTGGRRMGRAQVEQFFGQLAESVDFKQFEPREFIAERNKVVALGYYDGVAKKTGRPFKSDWVMVFTVANGKIAQFREYADVVNITAAF